jgi:hypothetical protein
MENGDLKNYLYRHRQSETNVRVFTQKEIDERIFISSLMDLLYPNQL